MRIIGTDIIITKGDSAAIQVKLTQGSGADKITVPFVEGDKVFFTVKRTLRSKKVQIQKVITSFQEDGTAYINIEPEDTRDMQTRYYFYDIQLSRANGQVSTLIKPAKFTIAAEVTSD